MARGKPADQRILNSGSSRPTVLSTAQWVIQSLREEFPFETAPRPGSRQCSGVCRSGWAGVRRPLDSRCRGDPHRVPSKSLPSRSRPAFCQSGGGTPATFSLTEERERVIRSSCKQPETPSSRLEGSARDEVSAQIGVLRRGVPFASVNHATQSLAGSLQVSAPVRSQNGVQQDPSVEQPCVSARLHEPTDRCNSTVVGRSWKLPVHRAWLPDHLGVVCQRDALGAVAAAVVVGVMGPRKAFLTLGAVLLKHVTLEVAASSCIGWGDERAAAIVRASPSRPI